MNFADYPHVEKAVEYAKGVRARKIPAGRWVRLACKRFLDDLKTHRKPSSKYCFDPIAASKPCLFIENLPHSKGKWAGTGETLELEAWQCFFVCNVFGWLKRADGLRRFTRALLYVPRKNGKSALAAGIALYMLCADGEFAAEVYTGATSEKQAWEVFRPAKVICQRLPDLVEYYGIDINAKSLVKRSDGSRFETLIGNPGDGGSPHCAIVDEYHEHPNDRLFDTMETGMLAREQPLMLVITTAGSNMAGPCYDLQLDLQQVLEGNAEDDETFGVIYTKDKSDKWHELKALVKANPNWGISVDTEKALAAVRRAKANPRKQASVKTKHLNIWVGSMDAFFNVESWEHDCANPALNIEDFKGCECWLGLDLASRVDIAALEIVFRPEENRYVRFGRYFVPQAAVDDPQNKGQEAYKGWVEAGVMTATEGEMIDFRVIRDAVLEIVDTFDVVELAFDPAQATMLINELIEYGVECVEMRSTTLNFSQPMKDLEGLIKSGFIQHDGDPVMKWMIGNVIAKPNAKDEVYPRKERDENKIDGVISLLMCLNRAYVPVYNHDEAIDDLIIVDT